MKKVVFVGLLAIAGVSVSAQNLIKKREIRNRSNEQGDQSE